MGRDPDVVCVVAASSAWPFYRAASAYVCQPMRTFRDAGRLGFYSGRRIHPLLPLVEHVEEVDATDEEAARRTLSVDPLQRRVGIVIAAALHHGEVTERSQVVLLSSPESGATVRIEGVGHEGPAAWTMFQRYAPLAALQGARTTTDLEAGSRADA